MILKVPVLFEIKWTAKDGIDHELLREALITYFENRIEDFAFRSKALSDQKVEQFFTSKFIEDMGIPRELVRIISSVQMITRERALKMLK